MGEAMYPIEIVHEEDDRFLVRARQHRFLVDQPKEGGGTDHGPTPTELMVVSLGACVGFFAERFLRRHDLPTEGLGVGCRYRLADDRPSRIGVIEIDVHLAHPLPARYEELLQRVIDGCTLHNTLRVPPQVSLSVRVSQAA